MGPQGQYSCSPTFRWFLIQLWQEEKYSAIKRLVSPGWHIKPSVTLSLSPTALNPPHPPTLQPSVPQHTHRTLKSAILLCMFRCGPPGSPGFKYERIMVEWVMLTVSLTGILCALYPHLTVSEPRGTNKTPLQKKFQSLLMASSGWMQGRQ